MRKLLFFLSCLGLFVITGFNIYAQTPAPTATPDLSGIKANLAAGEVTVVTDQKVSLKTKDGMIDVLITPTTAFKRVTAENPDPRAAVASSLKEVGVGDKVVVTGIVSPDKATIPAKSFILLTKADIAKRDTDEKTKWRTRGVFGRVASVDFKTQEITLTVSNMMGSQKVTITPKDTVSYMRYAEDSVKYSDAKASNFAEIRIGDQVRALGDKSEDGLSLKAEQIVSGAFKTVVGTITAIDTAKNEVTVKDLNNNKSVTIVLNPNTQLKKYPEEMANAMARMQQGGGGTGFQMKGQGDGQGKDGGNKDGGNKDGGNKDGGNQVFVMRNPGGNGQGPGGPGGGGRFRAGGGDINQLFDNLPATSLAELKVGDQIAISSSSSVTSDRLTAIKLISGVEPFVKMQQTMNAARNAAREGARPSFDIPGLDGGFGAP